MEAKCVQLHRRHHVVYVIIVFPTGIKFIFVEKMDKIENGFCIT